MGVCAGSRAAYTSSGNEKSSKQDEDLEALCIAEDDEKDLDTNGNSKDKLLVNKGEIHDDAGFLDDLCIAEGGLEGKMADFQENGWSMKKYGRSKKKSGVALSDAAERKTRKQVDSDLSKTYVRSE